MNGSGQVRRVYPARRAIEHAGMLAGIRPLRLFAVLWPLWRVETTADVYDEQAYGVVDRFLVRAVSEAGFSRVDELATFFGIPVPLVQRCVTFLSTIGHLRVDGDTVRLTDLGLRSVRADVRYVAKESRQDVLVERFTARPLPRPYYQGSVPIFSSPQVPEDRLSDRSRFFGIFAGTPFRPDIIEKLAHRADRVDVNLPAQLRNLRLIQETEAFLPAYVIETAGDGLLVYTALAAQRDEFFEAVCRQVPTITQLVGAEERSDPREIWTAWLAERTAGRGTLGQLANGVWRATLRADAFGPDGKLPLSRVGSYELRKRHFLQLWCADQELRERALMERVLAMSHGAEVTSKADLRQRAATVARQLEVAEPDLAEVRRYGERHRMHARIARIDALD